MNDESAMIAGCLRNPRDMMPRLVLADWLEEHGQAERAELLRIQAELFTINEKAKALRERRDELISWKAPDTFDCLIAYPASDVGTINNPLLQQTLQQIRLDAETDLTIEPGRVFVDRKLLQRLMMSQEIHAYLSTNVSIGIKLIKGELKPFRYAGVEFIETDLVGLVRPELIANHVFVLVSH